MGDATGLVAPELGSPHLVAEVRGRVLHLRIDRVERRNAFTQDMYRGIKRAAVWADEQRELDAVCLTGTDRWFGAGGDMSGASSDPEGLAAEWDPTDQFPFRHLERCSKLWVARINGLCHAGGLVLALHCDVTIASDQARFRAPELLRGIPDPFLTARLAAMVGVARARSLLFTAREVSAAEAGAMGLVGQVVAHDDLDAATEDALAAIARTGPAARAAVKRDLNARLPLADVGLFFHAIRSAEMVEGMTAFIEKREPDWPRG
ncbi:enoyl-CoA hydratase/isomerase family protein [Aquihabitans sp. G128]|uniref:enoyl-CoA hydratase/isomerase family protein n=1 Tax=Aquihabitans sp. G128 TaxID=2849779 RepID=UPI001C23B942|nr:enoyl-CoA hydratase/isomerase family protein [Aquihabitans sp. G128]QXC61644.1 enoyl-CoA hydratase/isomerase family protein [Aquihabitans sp. G128]